ncbi:MAG: branched-chain amino acid ABC transporter permease [Acidisphaera sp.]|nr:branched-chain amino acid ABC transporter permease [Acidisphaera sp.]
MSAAVGLNLAVAGLIQGLLIALAGLAVSLCFAVARFPNAATGDFMTFAAYAGVAAQAWTGSLLAGAASAVLLTAGLAVASYVLVFRNFRGRSLVAPLIASIGLAFLLRSVLTFFVGFDQHSFHVPIARAIVFAGARVRPIDLWLAGTSAVTLLAVLAVLFLTPIGRRMRAVADNPELARASGIRARAVMLTLWTLIGACSAVGGVMLGLQTVVVPEMGWNLLLPAFAAAVLGGVGNPTGAVLAGIALGLVQALSTPLVGFTYQTAISFILLIATLVLRPQGLLGRAEPVR